MALDSGEINSGGADIARVVNTITATGEMNAAAVGFVLFEGKNNGEICSRSIGWFISVVDEMDFVGTIGHGGADPLCKTANFIGGGL